MLVLLAFGQLSIPLSIIHIYIHLQDQVQTQTLSAYLMVPEVVTLLLSFVAFVSVVLCSHMFSGTLYLVTSVFKDTFNMMNTCYILT